MTAVPATPGGGPISPAYDAFISHASEDKACAAEPLFRQLVALGYRIWYDKAVLKLGDSPQEDRRGTAAVSLRPGHPQPSFFEKQWPQDELDGLTARETVTGEKVILPIWHEVSKAEVLRYSPMLAGKLAVSTDGGLDQVIAMIVDVLGPPVRAAVLVPPVLVPVHSLDNLAADELDALRREVLRGGHPRFPEDGGILRLERTTGFGMVGEHLHATCPPCGTGVALRGPRS